MDGGARATLARQLAPGAVPARPLAPVFDTMPQHARGRGRGWQETGLG